MLDHVAYGMPLSLDEEAFVINEAVKVDFLGGRARRPSFPDQRHPLGFEPECIHQAHCGIAQHEIAISIAPSRWPYAREDDHPKTAGVELLPDREDRSRYSTTSTPRSGDTVQEKVRQCPLQQLTHRLRALTFPFAGGQFPASAARHVRHTSRRPWVGGGSQRRAKFRRADRSCRPA